MSRDVTTNFLSPGMAQHQAWLPVSDISDATQKSAPKGCQEPTKKLGAKSGQNKEVLQIDDRLDRIESRLASLQTVLNEIHKSALRATTFKEYYTTQEVAQILKKRPYTVREWCRLGRVYGEKSHSGRGLDEEWRISHSELIRIQNEGLLPQQNVTAINRPRSFG